MQMFLNLDCRLIIPCDKCIIIQKLLIDTGINLLRLFGKQYTQQPKNEVNKII